MDVQIICISKDNGNHYAHDAVTHYHWVGDPRQPAGWIYTRQSMVDFLKAGNRAYVQDRLGKVWCEVRSNGRIEFLQTVADGRPTDNLLQLPECQHR